MIHEGRERKDVEKQVQEVLDVLGHDMTVSAVRIVALLVRGPIRHCIRGVYIKERGLEKVSLISFLPSFFIIYFSLSILAFFLFLVSFYVMPI